MTKYLFDIIYGLLCMNVRLGVIHMDLHLNNTILKPQSLPHMDYKYQNSLNDVCIYKIFDDIFNMPNTDWLWYDY